MNKEMIVSSNGHETMVAILEDDQVVEVFIEREQSRAAEARIEQPAGDAGDSAFFKQNAILVTATASSAPAQGGKTMIQYSNQLISSDIPAPQGVDDLRYVDEPPELTFAAPNQDAIVDFYRKTLAAAGWKSTMDKMVDVDDKPTMIFRNPAKDMLTLSMSGARGGKLGVSVRFQSAAEIAERDRKRKEAAPKLRAAAEAKAAKEAKEAAELAERNKVPKVVVTLPADAKDVKQTNDSIKFTVGKGKAKAAVESLRTQFRDAGWKEDVASLERMAGTLLFSKGDGQSVNITYSDTGFMPTEVSLSAMRVELEAAKRIAASSVPSGTVPSRSRTRRRQIARPSSPGSPRSSRSRSMPPSARAAICCVVAPGDKRSAAACNLSPSANSGCVL